MVKAVFVATAIFALSYPASTVAGPEEQWNCVENNLGRENWSKLGDELAVSVINLASGVYSDWPIGHLDEVVEACASLFGWNDYKREQARFAAPLEMVRPKLRLELSSRGVGVVSLDDFLAKNWDPSDIQSSDFWRDLISIHGVNSDDKVQIELIRLYWMTGFLSDEAKQEFIRGVEPPTQ